MRAAVCHAYGPAGGRAGRGPPVPAGAGRSRSSAGRLRRRDFPDVLLAADAIRPIPPGVDMRIATAFDVAHRTAYHVLRSVAWLQPGEELVVLGAVVTSGGGTPSGVLLLQRDRA